METTRNGGSMHFTAISNTKNSSEQEMSLVSWKVLKKRK
jgi:hypothetical protein